MGQGLSRRAGSACESARPRLGAQPRGYTGYFGNSRLDWAYQAAILAGLPSYSFGEEQYKSTGLVDFGEAVRSFAEEQGFASKRAWALQTGGMWGGPSILRPAFPLIRSKHFAARGTVDNLTDLQTRIPPVRLTIAVHVRMGDFLPYESSSSTPLWTRWNIGLPLEWYAAVCRTLTKQLTVPHAMALGASLPTRHSRR